MSDLSGRELDRAIAEALGYSLTRDIATGEPMCRHTLEIIPEFHASVDALKEVDPCDGHDYCILIDQQHRECWHVKIECLLYCDSTFAWGTTEPEARARALLAWLTRENKV